MNAFECMLVTAGREIPARAFAVAVTAVDSSGERITPESDAWFHSDLLGTDCQYAPASDATTASRLKAWTSASIPDSFLIEAVAWPSGGDDIPVVIALGISAVPEDPGAPRTWQLLHPQENHA
ncbi:hypothetical protein V1260_07970 [Brachybacterium sp. J144]|uniref:hypothetical protein n=1 Tax=Brachybacterium sp. J144 TaxID=3116487 RepID=UPI002E75D11D|nr:hypothetical protein [Brachybacterium sp. J144]MEE1650728.1 hypothetical protein [Brachybacterium sp. J144]